MPRLHDSDPGATFVSVVDDGPGEQDPRGSQESLGPVELVRRSQASYQEETRLLLHGRLKAASFLMSGIATVFTARSLLLGIPPPEGMIIQLTILGCWVGVAVALSRFRPLSLFGLRTLELTLGGATTAQLAAGSYFTGRETAQGLSTSAALLDSPLMESLLISNAMAPLLPFLWLMMFYGMMIPNRWQRTALVLLPVALTPIAIKMILGIQFPEVRGLASAEKISLGLSLNLLGYVSAVYGTYVIHSLRRQAYQARRLGQYQLVEKLGAGGMGEVWRGHHSMLARPAAIKLIRPDLLEAQAGQETRLVLSRFEREAQATARLHSAHSIVLYDFGVTEDETFYYVMELLDGLDFQTLVERFGPVPPARAIHLLLQACESLADAHASGLIHRDVKPANLFACRRGKACDFVKVVDFGLVKTQELQGPKSARLTEVNSLAGTPAYMAPEQVLRLPLDGRADLYGLGCVAYWLITGRDVFKGADAVSALIDHVKTDPTPPSEVTDRPIRSDFERVILSCLAKAPEDRPADAEELARSLNECRDAGAWGQDDAADWWKRHLESTDDFENPQGPSTSDVT